MTRPDGGVVCCSSPEVESLVDTLSSLSSGPSLASGPIVTSTASENDISTLGALETGSVAQMASVI